MSVISIELKKYRRSGLPLILFAPGLLGFLYSVVVFGLRKETLLSLPLPPMTILLTQLYGVVMLLNLFGIVVAVSLIFNIEYQGNAIQKMISLPISMVKVYGAKCLIITCTLIVNVVLQSVALGYLGATYLSAGAFDIAQLLSHAVYYFIVALPVATFMMLIASRIENIWVTLGVGVAGFISGMAMTLGNNPLFLINPFTLIMQPAFSTTAALNGTVITVSIIEAVIFYIAGLLAAKHFKHE